MSYKSMSPSQKDEVRSKRDEKTDKGRVALERARKRDADRSTTQIKHETRDEGIKKAGLDYKDWDDYVESKKPEKSKAEKKKDAEKWADMKMDERKYRARRRALERRRKGK